MQGSACNWIITKTTPQLPSQRNTDRIQVTSFSVKQIYVYSQQIHTIGHEGEKKTFDLHHLNLFYRTLG